MDATEISKVQASCPAIPPLIVQDFLERMDPDYFRQFPLKTITSHVEMVSKLTLQSPCALDIKKEKDGTLCVTVVAYDYFFEFATVCGLLSAFGLDIREAFIFTSREATSTSSRQSQVSSRSTTGSWWHRRQKSMPSGLSRKKVVDVFRVQILSGSSFGPSQEHRLHDELVHLIRLLDENQVREARARVNRLLVETLGRLNRPIAECMHPVQIHFNNALSQYDTVLDIRSTDTPAFLYTFANALSMRGIYISKATIEVDGTRVRNRLYVRSRLGGKIQGRREQEELSAAVAIIKEFTYFLPHAPDPARALDHFDQLLDQLLPDKRSLSLLRKKSLLAHLAQLFGTSDFLWEDFLRRQHANLLPAMGAFHAGAPARSKPALKRDLDRKLKNAKTQDARKALLNQFKDQELFRIDMKHLLSSSSLPEFSEALTNLADVIVDRTLQESLRSLNRLHKQPLDASGRPVPFAICGLGKLGGRELGYASDIEVLFVYGTGQQPAATDQRNISEYFELLVQEFLQWIEAKQEGIFHIDTRLRPHGEKGLLANSLDEIRHYYRHGGGAAPFERQALIKLRHIAGDASLGKAVEQHRDDFVYSSDPWPLETALHLRQRQMTELVSPGATHVKYSPGGLIDVEYTIQYLQLIHGHACPAIRTPNTLVALHQLAASGIVSRQEASVLEQDYLFFRQLIDALRIVRGNAHDLLLPPSGSDAMIFLARRLGFIFDDWQAGAAALEKEIVHRMKRAHDLFQTRFQSKLESMVAERPEKKRATTKAQAL